MILWHNANSHNGALPKELCDAAATTLTTEADEPGAWGAQRALDLLKQAAGSLFKRSSQQAHDQALARKDEEIEQMQVQMKEFLGKFLSPKILKTNLPKQF